MAALAKHLREGGEDEEVNDLTPNALKDPRISALHSALVAFAKRPASKTGKGTSY